MAQKRDLTYDEQVRCIGFLKRIGVKSPDHRILRDRTFFGIFLSGLNPSEVGKKEHPNAEEFKEMVHLLSMAGVEKVREMVELSRPLVAPPPRSKSPAPPAPPLKPKSSPTERSIHRETSKSVQLPPRTSEKKPLPAPHQHLKKSQSVAPPPKPKSPPSEKPVQRESSRTVQVPHQGGGKKPLPIPHQHLRNSQSIEPLPKPRPEVPPPVKNHAPVKKAPDKPAPESKDGQTPPASITPRAQFHKDIQILKPSEEARERLRHLKHAETEEEAIELGRRHAKLRQFHDAFHILVEFLRKEGLKENLIKASTEIILAASHYNREKSIPPFNMLYECEELSEVLAQKIPDMSKLAATDERTSKLYYFVKLVYKTWIMHCHVLLEYKYLVTNKDLMRRNWLEPMEFSFLLEPMRIGVASRLPLDLLRFILAEIHACIELGEEVIAHQAKKAKFRGDVLRLIAAPTKDVIPDLQFEIYREITESYLEEGDTQNATIFCRQALLIHKNDSDMLRLREEIAGRAHKHPQKKG